jgi:hypothetical protein
LNSLSHIEHTGVCAAGVHRAVRRRVVRDDLAARSAQRAGGLKAPSSARSSCRIVPASEISSSFVIARGIAPATRHHHAGEQRDKHYAADRFGLACHERAAGLKEKAPRRH